MTATLTHNACRTPFGALMRDLAAGFRQQMYCWGRDVLHPDGNLLITHGFSKRPSEGLQGTSCYSRLWQGGQLELHGSHAGWIGKHGGFLFIRPLGRCVRWLDDAHPVPGDWHAGQFETHVDGEMHGLAMPFLDWWLEYESTIEMNHGKSYREACHRQYKKLPKTRAWLAPDNAQRWINGLRYTPEKLVRANRYGKSPT